MLDGLLGRGLSSKCKSLIKQTVTRIDAIRRKRNATQRFLKKDVADLLAKGLDVNAFGRAEGLLVELRLSSCYDFVEEYCECILKHLSIMQKQGECPEECRVAISSLMFAAARFSDLPELRDLRHIFQEKYGNSLEYYANKEFVDNLASKPPMLENKIRLMQDIALEYSVKWDSRAFELRMSRPPASSSNQRNAYGSFTPDDNIKLPKAKENKFKVLNGKESSPITNGHDASAKDVPVQAHVRDYNVPKREEDPQFFGRHASKHKLSNGWEPKLPKESSNVPFQGRHESNAVQHKFRNGNEEQTAAKTERQGSSSHGKQVDPIGSDYKLRNGMENTIVKRNGPHLSSHGGPELPVKNGENETSFAGNNHDGQHQIANSIRKVQDERMERTKPPDNMAIPPPYHKSRCTKSRNASFDDNGAPLDPSKHSRDDAGSGSQRTHPGHEEHHVEDDMAGNPKPKRRSSRRRHSKLPPNPDNHGTIEETGVTKRRSRREKSREGLHILLDGANDHHPKDEDERMLDKLLLHYSHKPSSYDPEKLRHKMKADPSHHQASDAAETRRRGRREKPQENPETVPTPVRSASLPREQSAQLEAPKVFSRVISLQPVRHVHPKLPDYDALAARFAAMKAK